ncbi:MAG: hypothetical protein U0746_07800 [Gemmataceae bacterium]
MSHLANDTLPLEAPVARSEAHDDDLMPHMLHIVRRAMRKADSASRVGQAIRTAVGVNDDEVRQHLIAQRIGALIAPRLSAPAGRRAHCETVRA